MEYLVGKVVEIYKQYLILETDRREGIKIWTIKSDQYFKNTEYKVFICKEIKLNNNLLSYKNYGFLNRNDAVLFSLLNQIQGIGPKTSFQILKNSSSEIFKFIKENNILALMALSGVYKHANQIMEFFKKSSNKAILDEIVFDEKEKEEKEIMKIKEDIELNDSIKKLLLQNE